MYIYSFGETGRRTPPDTCQRASVRSIILWRFVLVSNAWLKSVSYLYPAPFIGTWAFIKTVHLPRFLYENTRKIYLYTSNYEEFPPVIPVSLNTFRAYFCIMHFTAQICAYCVLLKCLSCSSSGLHRWCLNCSWTVWQRNYSAKVGGRMKCNLKRLILDWELDGHS